MKKEIILIADSDNETMHALCKSFPADDYDVIFADNGIDAVKKSMSNLPDLIILCDEMPQMNGYQVCRLLKNDPVTRSIPIIMLASDNKFNQKYSGLVPCPDEYAPRNGDPQKLLMIIRQRLNGNGRGKPLILKEKINRNIDYVDIIKDLNNLLDKKVFEAAMFSDLTGLVQNIFSYDDLALAVMDIFSKLIDYSIAMIVILSEDESKLIIHLHEDINMELFSEIKESALSKIREEMIGFDTSKLWIRIIREDRVKGNGKVDNKGIDMLLFSHFAMGGILKKGFIIYGKPEDKADAGKEDMLNVVVNETCIILENSWLYSRLYKNIKNMTITDGLTSVYNHKYIIGLVNQEFSRAKRYKHNISIIMFDIDFFKKINDTFGHQTGDVVLREIAAIINRAIRKSDVVGRYGGEEFTIILPETDTNDALLFAERLREKVESYNFFNPSDPLKITASMGVATFPAHGMDDPKSFIKCADQALYAAKESGRNRVCVCENHD